VTALQRKALDLLAQVPKAGIQVSKRSGVSKTHISHQVARGPTRT
jgi:hypothetical protein